MDQADSNTPFIRNAWYWSLNPRRCRTPMAHGARHQRRAVSHAGAVALANRCCHRSFPLVHGTVDGDTIVCGYHGLRYDTTGKCIEIPMQKSVPASLRVRGFRTAEKGSFVWIWMGEESTATADGPPHQEWLDHPDWAVRVGYLYVKGSYVHLHENLLDLSHLSFLHAKTFGTPEYARAPVEMNCEGENLEVWRHVHCELPAIYARPWLDRRAALRARLGNVSPACTSTRDLPQPRPAGRRQSRSRWSGSRSSTPEPGDDALLDRAGAQLRDQRRGDGRFHDQGAGRSLQGGRVCPAADHRDAGAVRR
jgi:vanillate O-demethylase monooxygenase subunit